MPEAQIIQNEEALIIETPERVPLEFSLASIGNRFLAVAVDHLIQFLAIIIVAVVFIVIAGTGDSILSDDPGQLTGLSGWVFAVLIVALFALFAGYFAFFEWWWEGQTPGKRLMKLRVIREDGRPLTLWESIARNLLRIFDALPGVIVPVYSIGLIVVFLSNRDQRVGDIFAGTVVIRERTDEAPTFEETFSNPVSDAAIRRVQPLTACEGSVTGIAMNEIEVVETFLRRRWDLTDRQRVWMAWRIALPLMFRIKPKYDTATFTYEGFLEELLARFHAQRRFLN
jgi:uncharacterized RDD family membrane protein YckC